MKKPVGGSSIKYVMSITLLALACGKNATRTGSCLQAGSLNTQSVQAQWYDSEVLQTTGGYLVSHYAPSYQDLLEKNPKDITAIYKGCSARFEFYKSTAGKRMVDVWTEGECIEPISTLNVTAQVYVPQTVINGMGFERGYEAIELLPTELMMAPTEGGAVSRTRKFADASKDLPIEVRRKMLGYFGRPQSYVSLDAALDPADLESLCQDMPSTESEPRCVRFIKTRIYTLEVATAKLSKQAQDTLDILEDVEKKRRLAPDVNGDVNAEGVALHAQWKKIVQDTEPVAFDAKKAELFKDLARCGQPNIPNRLTLFCQHKDKVRELARDHLLIGGKDPFASLEEAKKAGIAEADFPAHLEGQFKAKLKGVYGVWKQMIDYVIAKKPPVRVSSSYFTAPGVHTGADLDPSKTAYLSILTPSGLKAHAGFKVWFEKNNIRFSLDPTKSSNFTQCFHSGSYVSLGRNLPLAAFGPPCDESGSAAALRLPARVATGKASQVSQPPLRAEAQDPRVSPERLPVSQTEDTVSGEMASPASAGKPAGVRAGENASAPLPPPGERAGENSQPRSGDPTNGSGVKPSSPGAPSAEPVSEKAAEVRC